MPRIDLLVPFSDKDEAKLLGARWDAVKKVWFAPPGADTALLAKWMLPAINIQSHSYYIAESITPCWRCGELTIVWGFLLPDGHQILEDVAFEQAGFGPDDQYEEVDLQAWLESPQSQRWVTSDWWSMPHYVVALSPEVKEQMALRSTRYRLDFSKTTNTSYWMNHCDHCAMKQGDFALYCEPSGAFLPINASEAAAITLHHIHKKFEACCDGHTYCDDDFRAMRKLK